jgi:hypothetical protein
VDSSALWGLIGTLVGATASIATALLTIRSSQDLERAKNHEERIDQARAFQRQTLLELQEAVHDVLRLVSQASHQDFLAHRAGQEWSKSLLNDEINEGVRLALRRVFILVERIADDDLRSNVKNLMGGTSRILLAQSEQESRYHLDKNIQDSGTLFEEIGKVLRRYYEPA